jgi:tetratricopeptide (TPR) repeat protein
MSSNASSLPRSELRPPAELHRRRAVAALAVGRHVEAVEAARRGRRGAQPAAAGALALLECEALFGLLRPADVLAVTNRALRRVGPDVDLRARLRVARAQALWLLGRATASRAEVLRASEEAQTGLTRARVVEAMALLAWRQDQDFSGARERLVESRRLFDEGGCVEGVARVLGAHAAVLRDEGRMAEALRVQALRVEVAETTTRLDSLAQAHNDRGDLLAYLGRWEEARRDLDRAADLFRRVGSPRRRS